MPTSLYRARDSSEGNAFDTGSVARQDRRVVWDEIRHSYDQVAGKYEARFLDELLGKPYDRDLLDGFARSTADPIVEVGCGPGQIGVYVRGRGRAVIGLDISEAMTQRAARRLDGAVVADMLRLPLASGSVAGLLAFYSIIHVRRGELETVLGEFARVLSTGGRVLFTAHEGQGELEHDEFLGERVPFKATLFELDELASAACCAGLEVLVAERRPPYQNEYETFRLYIEASKPAPNQG